MLSSLMLLKKNSIHEAMVNMIAHMHVTLWALTSHDQRAGSGRTICETSQHFRAAHHIAYA